MCGIVGFLARDADSTKFDGILASMLGRIGHRGPDAAGGFADDICALGTARLAIIDPAAGAQPMSDASGRYWLTYNGEIYNYRELRDELEAHGRVFRTRSDTEVLLEAWIAWGPECLPKLNGGFAFAIYDRDLQSLVLARDRFGKRPLYFTRHKDDVLFASEMKAFVAYPGFHFEQNAGQIASILGQWTPLPHQTGFTGIESLGLAEWLEIRDGTLTRRCYEHLTFDRGPAIATEADAIARIRATLIDSVRLRLRSDVEVGVYLSGGLDSSVIALLTSSETERPVRTFSLAFESADLDESDAQREISGFLKTDHTTLTIGHSDIVANFEAALYHAEVPTFRSAFVPMYLLSKRTREAGIKVVLSGEGADEAFLGYDLFKETQLRAAWDGMDGATRLQRIASLYPHLDHYGPQDLAAVTSLYHQFSRERMPGLFSHELRFQNGRFSTRLLREPGDAFAAITGHAAHDPGFGAMTAVQKAQWLEFQTLLPGYLLSTQGDRMALAHGVENRCPFLDKAVVDLAGSVNLRFDDGFEEKRLLRKAFADSLPPAISAKRKFPYRAPDSAAFAAIRPDMLDAVCSDQELAKLPYLDVRFARALVAKILSRPAAEISTKENQTFMFLMSLALLHRQFVSGERLTPAAPARMTFADYRAGARAGHASQGSFISVT
ncbi:MAG: asparagine synthase (glutamine-hydrolyzing) [Hyphomicrobium sp.]|jgi:asparagine synthase (glutamine-hydrolysing)|uniref:asparagine synthase (glutamine-hydrolyzing) n=1 Tax=Hyphomicrobium sp. TaxID=82 RepID=UPI0025B7F443|nr:asparagine synthase (glutamine-hydrolyzing) [Hyphomicrobium sp.]MBX9864416.1 asparagine synthase (glutamine-hydrolyzing) [Hyphomicrobium sp.]